MGLQNRVDPLGRLIETPARGGWLGNRGLLHDPQQRIRRPWRLRAWLICLLQFKERQRTIMSPGLYTELFFLDEATALAAGHRPCAECRRADYNRFKAAAERGRGDVFARAAQMDNALHIDRIGAEGRKRSYCAPIEELPDGVFVVERGEPWLKWQGGLHHWTPQSYVERRKVGIGEAEVLTPRLTVEAIRAGYVPQIALD